MTPNLIETFKTSMYSPKHTNNTTIHDRKLKIKNKIFKQSYFPKILA